MPFPHVERAVATVRPALVLTRRPVGPSGLLIWAAMITNAERAPWPGDLLVGDWERIGLIVPSVVRTSKIVVAETASASLIGRLGEADLAAVRRLVAEYLGF